MDDDRWRQVDELLQQALELEPSARPGFLASACGDDAELRASVEELLSFEDEPLSLFEQPAASLAAELMAPAEFGLVPGQSLGHHEILRPLGRGGMGEIYLARDARLGRETALKLLPVEFTTDPARVRRFRQEARAASALNHPNIITIYEVGEHEGQHFIATEYIEGETLRRRLADGRLDPEETLDVAVQVVAALAAAHRAGIVHRDIKPENVMVRPDGYVKVLDFGIAKLTEAAAAPREGTDTTPGLVIGTVRYRSPEQARGLDLDARSDIFSVGVVLYELLTGQPPFEGATNSDVIAEILRADASPLHLQAPGVPEELEHIVEKALRKDPEERYQTAGELLDALRSVVRGLELRAELSRLRADSGERTTAPDIVAGADAPTIDERTGLPPSRGRAERLAPRSPSRVSRRAVAASSLVAVSLAAVLGVAYVWTRSSAPFERITITRLVGSESSWAAVISPDGTYVAEMRSGDGLWIRHLATDSVVRIIPESDRDLNTPSFSPDSNYVFYGVNEMDPESSAPPVYTVYRIPVLGGDSKRVLVGASSPIAFTSDGRRIAFMRAHADERTEIVVCEADGSGERVVASRSVPEYFSFGGLAWSPDGRTVVCGTNEGLAVVSVDDGAERRVTSGQFAQVERVVWAPVAARLFMLARPKGKVALQIWELSYPDLEPRRITNDLEDYVVVSATADAKALVGVQQARVSNLWVVPQGDSARARQITDGRHTGIRHIAWTPDGRIVAVSTASGAAEVWVMNADGTGRKQLTSGMTAVATVAVSRDGRYILFTAKRDDSFYLWRMDMDGGGLEPLARSGFSPTCSPDGWVVYHDADDGTLWKRPIEGGEPVRLSTVPALHPQLSPDGKLIACQYSPKGADGPSHRALLSIDDGRVVTMHDVPGGRWAPDGRAFLSIQVRDWVGNIWSQPIDGGPRRQITAFTEYNMFAQDSAPDGTLVCARGSMARDTVLITDAEP